jgi:hypothetical protein
VRCGGADAQRGGVLRLVGVVLGGGRRLVLQVNRVCAKTSVCAGTYIFRNRAQVPYLLELSEGASCSLRCRRAAGSRDGCRRRRGTAKKLGVRRNATATNARDGQRRSATAVVLLLYTVWASLEEYGRSRERRVVGERQEQRMWCWCGCGWLHRRGRGGRFVVVELVAEDDRPGCARLRSAS